MGKETGENPHRRRQSDRSGVALWLGSVSISRSTLVVKPPNPINRLTSLYRGTGYESSMVHCLHDGREPVDPWFVRFWFTPAIDA